MTNEVQSVVRAFAILRVLAAHDDAVPLAILAGETGLAKSTASRLLSTLETLSMVGRGPVRGTYTAGPALAAIAGPAHTISHLLGVARPYLDDLVARFGEDAALAVADGSDVIYADQAHSRQPVQVPDWTRRRFAPHTVASGFVVMAWWPAQELDAYLAGDLTAATRHTLTDASAIRSRLAEVRRRRYVWTTDEWVDGVTAVAAPVLTPDDQLLAVVNLFGPSFRFPDSRDPHAIGVELRDAAERLARTMAGPPGLR